MPFFLIVHPKMGIAGDMFIGALFSLTSPKIAQAVENILQELKTYGTIEFSRREGGIEVTTQFQESHLHFHEARTLLAQILEKSQISTPYQIFAKNTLETLIRAETYVHTNVIPQMSNAKRTYTTTEHNHTHHNGTLHEAADIILDTFLPAFLLYNLNIDLSNVFYIPPIYVGDGKITFSHGTFDVPAPATKYILEEAKLEYRKGPVPVELTTPTGAALMAALNPKPLKIDHIEFSQSPNVKKGIGVGHKKLSVPNHLICYLTSKKPISTD